jgi:hypothetical protein
MNFKPKNTIRLLLISKLMSPKFRECPSSGSLRRNQQMMRMIYQEEAVLIFKNKRPCSLIKHIRKE